MPLTSRCASPGLLPKLVPNYIQVGNRVWSLKNVEDISASWRVGSLGAHIVKHHLECTTSFIPSTFNQISSFGILPWCQNRVLFNYPSDTGRGYVPASHADPAKLGLCPTGKKRTHKVLFGHPIHLRRLPFEEPQPRQ